VLVLLLRPVAFLIALLPTKLKTADRFLISWFGPRGLSTLLLILLPVFGGVPGGDTLFALCSLVVLLSVVLHGGTVMLIGRTGARRAARAAAEEAEAETETEAEAEEAAPAEGEATPAPLPAPTPPPMPASTPAPPAPAPAPVRAETPAPPAEAPAAAPATNGAREEAQAADGRASAPLPLLPHKPQPGKILALDPIRITLKQIKHLQQAGVPVVFVDARTERSYDNSDEQAVGAVRLVPGPGGTIPGGIADQARQLGLPQDAVLAIFCA
jgi:hypothetical protein